MGIGDCVLDVDVACVGEGSDVVGMGTGILSSIVTQSNMVYSLAPLSLLLRARISKGFVWNGPRASERLR